MAFERGRQLYVAATRARKHLHILGSVSVSSNKDGASIRRPTTGTLLALLWPSVDSQFEAVLRQSTTAPTVAASMTAPLMLRRLPLHWQPPQPQVSTFITKRSEMTSIVTQPEFDWVGETSRHIGTVVHRELERLTQAEAVPLSSWDANQSRSRFAFELAELGVPERYRADACERALAAVTNTLDDSRGRWILGAEEPHREAQSEFALSGVIAGEVRSIVIDRSFVVADGTRWIVDFKTSSHEGSGLEAFLASEVERYRDQLLFYAQLMRGYRPNESIKAALYFPLLKAWREVPV